MKRFIALFLAISMGLCGSVSVFGDDKGLADAILKAKQYIEIPSDRTDIDYHISEDENNDPQYYLSWSGDNGSTNVTLDYDGCLLSYYTYDYNEDDALLAKYPTEVTEQTARDFLRKVYGDNAVCFKLTQRNLDLYEHNYSYVIYQHDIRLTNGIANIAVNPISGNVASFNGVGQEFFKLNYPQPENIIDVNTAMTALYNGNYPAPQYNTVYNYNESVPLPTVFLAFTIPYQSKGVDAVTGEIKELNYNYSNMKGFNTASATAEEATMDGGSGFTPEELAAIDSVEGLISTDEAVKIIKDLFPIAANENFSSSGVYSDKASDKYLIYLNSENANARLNGVTGIVEQFNAYNYDNETKANGDYINTANDLIHRAAYDIEDKLGAPSTERSYSDTSMNIDYSRVENGYKCTDEGVWITFNGKGEITSYYRTWYDNLTYPNPNNVLEGDEAINALTEVFDFDLVYSVDNDYNVTLAYTFNKSGNMSATSPQQVDYMGKVLNTVSESSIDDVKGHWSEKYVSALFNSGYQLNDTLFRPDQPITFGELEDLYGKDYAVVLRNNGTENDEYKNNRITRYELAAYILEYSGLGKLKNVPDIFTTDYTDTISKEYLPAVAITRGLGILSGDEKGAFNGEREVTRAEAAVALYNILTNAK